MNPGLGEVRGQKVFFLNVLLKELNKPLSLKYVSESKKDHSYRTNWDSTLTGYFF